MRVRQLWDRLQAHYDLAGASRKAVDAVLGGAANKVRGAPAVGWFWLAWPLLHRRTHTGPRLRCGWTRAISSSRCLR